jgi:hypothetical protein
MSSRALSHRRSGSAGCWPARSGDDVLTYVQGPRLPVRVRDGKITISCAEHGDAALIFREPQHPLLDEDCEGTVYVAERVADRELLRGYLLVDTDEAVAELRRHNAAALAATPRLEQPARRTKHPAPEIRLVLALGLPNSPNMTASFFSCASR